MKFNKNLILIIAILVFSLIIISCVPPDAKNAASGQAIACAGLGGQCFRDICPSGTNRISGKAPDCGKKYVCCSSNNRQNALLTSPQAPISQPTSQPQPVCTSDGSCVSKCIDQNIYDSDCCSNNKYCGSQTQESYCNRLDHPLPCTTTQQIVVPESASQSTTSPVSQPTSQPQPVCTSDGSCVSKCIDQNIYDSDCCSNKYCNSQLRKSYCQRLGHPISCPSRLR